MPSKRILVTSTPLLVITLPSSFVVMLLFLALHLSHQAPGFMCTGRSNSPLPLSNGCPTHAGLSAKLSS